MVVGSQLGRSEKLARSLLVHSANVFEGARLCARLCGGDWEPGRADLVSRLELFLGQDGARCCISHGALTVRRNNINLQGMNVTQVSHSCNISV